jgi:hypothetical protein
MKLSALLVVLASSYCLAQAPLPLKTWKALVSFRPPTAVQQSVLAKGAGWYVQPIETSKSDLNLDYYAVKVSKLPAGLTPEALFAKYKALLLDPNRKSNERIKFAYHEPGGDITKPGTLLKLTFTPFSFLGCKTEDYCKDLEFLKNGQKCDVLEKLMDLGSGLAPAYNAFIVVGMHSPKELRVSTVCSAAANNVKWAFKGEGEHPVSGNRAFGWSPSGANFIFYAMGADRISSFKPLGVPDTFDENFGALGFCVAEIFWRQISEEFVSLVKAGGGEAAVGAQIRYTAPWNQATLNQLYDPASEKAPDWLPK